MVWYEIVLLVTGGIIQYYLSTLGGTGPLFRRVRWLIPNLGTTAVSVLIAILGKGHDEPMPAIEGTHDCSACLVPHSDGSMLTFSVAEGGCGHHICNACAANLIQHASETGRAACPQCGSSIPQETLMCMDPSLFCAVELAQVAHACQDCIRCPRCFDAFFVDGDDRIVLSGIETSCGQCGFSFCTRCLKAYHYLDCAGRCCSEVMREKKMAWLQWQAEGQAAYVQQVAALDAEYASRLQQVSRDQAAQRLALEAFRRDEQSKSNWRHCPHCSALWQGTDACSHVTCGVLEAAMGSRRGAVGCGRNFDFLREGLPYRPAQPMAMHQLEAPARPTQVVHRDVPCARCTGEVRGVRFKCLQCAFYNLCLECLAVHGSRHAAEETSRISCEDDEDDGHVFDIIFEPLA